MGRLSQLVAPQIICDHLVQLGIKPKAFFWHIREDHPEGKKNLAGGPIYIWDVMELENPIYIAGEVVPAFTMEELFVLMGYDLDKPDLLPEANTAALIDKEKKVTYLDYKFAIYTVTSMRSWPRGALAAADLLRQALQGNKFNKDKANERYEHFFKHGEDGN